MLSELSPQTQKEVRSLRIVLEGKGNYSSIEQRDQIIDQLKYDISEFVLTILMREDAKKLNYFLISK